MKASGRYPSESTASSTPWRPRFPRTRSSMGTPTMGSICLGIDRVSGRRRVPSPPTSTTARTGYLAAVVLVDVGGLVVDDAGGVVWMVVEVCWGSVPVVGSVVVVGAWPLSAGSRAAIAAVGGFLMVVPAGAKAIVMSWPLVSLRFRGSPVTTRPDLLVARGPVQ